MTKKIKKEKVFNIKDCGEFSVVYILEKQNEEYLLTMELSDIAVIKNNECINEILNSIEELFKEEIKEQRVEAIYVPSSAYINVEESYSGVYIDVNYPADSFSDTKYLTDDVYQLEDEYGNLQEVGDIGICLVEIKQDANYENSIALEFKSFTIIDEEKSEFYLWNSLIKKNIYEELSNMFN